MPLIQIELTQEETDRLDVIAEKEKRARKHQAAVLLMERVAEIEKAESLQPEPSEAR